MKTRSLLLSAILVVAGSQLYAQKSTIGLMPSFNYTFKLKKDWKINGKLEQRTKLLAWEAADYSPNSFSYELTDFQIGPTYKPRPDQSISIHFLLRHRNGQYAYRGIQQFTWAKQLFKFRLGQRIRTDQLFALGSQPLYRLRYRLTFIVPLSGFKVDSKEPYLKVNHEYVGGFQGNRLQGEIRCIPGIGYAFNDRNKLESAIDYRFSSRSSSFPEHQFWITLGWYLSF